MNDGDFSNNYLNNGDKKRGRLKWGLLIAGLLIVTNLFTFFILSRVKVTYNPSNGDNGSSGITVHNEIPNEDVELFRKLFLVKDKLYNYYNGEIDEEKLVEGAIKGMTSSLNDPYTSYLNEEEFERLNQETEGSYVGVGIQVGVVEDQVVIISPFEGSPADEVGILPGDIILKVNGEEIGKDIDKAVGMMKGKKGKEVTLTLNRKNKGVFDVKIITDEIILITVKGEMIENNIGYISIKMFDENTGEAFKEKLAELQKAGAKGLVLDLRGNPGGLVHTCVEVASNFIPKGKTIVYTVDKYDAKKVYESKGGNAYDLPVVILTNEGTASASEIVSGALKDYKKATIVGEKTFGKGIVQTVLYHKMHGFGDGTALKVTISKYFTPNGEYIHKKGISPDIEVEYPEELLEKEYNRSTDPQLNEALRVINEKVNK